MAEITTVGRQNCVWLCEGCMKLVVSLKLSLTHIKDEVQTAASLLTHSSETCRRGVCETYAGMPARANTSAFMAYKRSLLLTPSLIFTRSWALSWKKKPLWMTNSALDLVP